MKRLGPYELGEELARGAMGVVYNARDPYLGRPLAIKVVRDEGLLEPESHERFRREALALARLRHPGVVAVHSAGVTPQGYPYLVMDLLSGGSLSRRMGGVPIPPREAVRITRELAAALDYAHGQGVLHRDVKPANVLLDSEGHAVLTDFGLAKVIGARRLTQTGDILGTPSYMAPEQIQGEGNLGPSADVYALGASLYRMLTGRPPLVASTLTELFLYVSERVPEPASRLAPEVDAELDRILARCLEKRPQARYPTMKSLLDDLESWGRAGQAQTEIARVPARAPEPAEAASSPAAPKPKRWLSAVGLALGLAFGFGAGLASAGSLDRASRSWRAPAELGEELEASFARGEARLAREDYEGALKDYLVVTKLGPACDAAWRGLGEARIALGDEEQGLEDLSRAVALDPRNVRAWSSRGQTLFGRADYAGAAEAYRRAVEVRPRSASLQTSLAFCLQKSGQEAAAREAWQRGRELDPRSGQSVLFEYHFGEAPREERLATLEGAAVLDPGEEGLLLRRARALLEAERYETAIAAYTDALRRRLRGPALLLGRGQALVLTGREQGGFNDIELVRELYPDEPSVLETRGRVFYRLARYAEALTDFEHLEREHPSAGREVSGLADSIRRARATGSYRVAQTVILKPSREATTGFQQIPVLPGKRLHVIKHDGEWAEVEFRVRGERQHGFVYFPHLRLAVDRVAR